MQNFIILAKIGEGAYSTVYTVKRKEDGLLYALKKVKLKGLSNKEKKNALNEVRILASVKSKYVISYRESFVDELDSTLCIIMEYADDGDLFQKINLYKKYQTNFEEIDIWRIFIQITKGLSDLHSYNILHRDLKSANIFLFRDGTAKLGDLNVSKITSRGLGCTQTGTPYYASPEVWKDEPYDLKSDIWSLGCILYEMIMLKTPFRADSMEKLYKKIMKADYPKINNKYSNDLSEIISRLLIVKSIFRPTTEDILNFKEVKDKIDEYDIYRTKKLKKNILINSYKNIRKNYKLNDIYDINKLLIEEEEKNKTKFKQANFVIDTIKMPKKLKLLDKRLPEYNYDSDKVNKLNILSNSNKILPMLKCKYKIDASKNNIENNNKNTNSNNINYLSQTENTEITISDKNIKKNNNNNKNYNNIKDIINEEDEEEKNNIKNHYVSKSIELSKIDFNNNQLMKTLKLKIQKNKENIFNRKGKIDLVVDK